MLYELDPDVYLAHTPYGKRTLVGTIEQRHNILSVMDAYHRESLRNGYASPESTGSGRSRDRARSVQMWKHGVLNTETIALIFGVSTRTINNNVRGEGSGRHRAIWGRINPDHAPYLKELLERIAAGDEVHLSDDAVQAVLCADPDPRMHTHLGAAHNLLGLTADGYVRDRVGMTDSDTVFPAPRPVIHTRRAVRVESLPTVEQAAHPEPVTTITDADTRAAVEAGDAPYAPKISFDDSGDSFLADLDDQLPEDVDLDDEMEEPAGNDEEAASSDDEP